MPKKVTIYDVAAAAEVSACCVSWVLREHPRSKAIKEETRARILETARKLGYRRNLLASATRTGKVNTLALIVDFEDIHHVTPLTQIISGIITEASRRSYSVKIFANDDLEASFRQIAENCLDKVISLSTPFEVREKTAQLAEKYSFDLVFAFEYGHGRFPAVNVDNIAMTSDMVRFLAEKGHRKIGYLGVTHPFHYAEDRRKGYLDGLKECSLPSDPRWLCDCGEKEEEIRKILTLPEAVRPTAFVAIADSLAARAQKVAQKLGLRVPEDLSVIGIGNTIIAKYTLATLTTVEEFLPEYGKLLTALVMGEDVQSLPDENNVYHTRTAIVERGSVCDHNNNNHNIRSNQNEEVPTLIHAY